MLNLLTQHQQCSVPETAEIPQPCTKMYAVLAKNVTKYIMAPSFGMKCWTTM